MVAPSVDAQTRNAIVYVDLPAATGSARAGMYAQGEIALGQSQALTVPQSAVVVRDGFSYVYTVGADQKVSQLKVQTGRQSGDRVEVTSGLKADARVVASGGAFLNHGDTVRVVDAPAAPAAAPAPHQIKRRHDQRLFLVDPQPDSRGHAVCAADGGRLHRLWVHESAKLSGSGRAHHQVTASLPGVAPSQLETDVARKLENALAPLQGLKHITTKVQDGVVSITAEFRMEKPSQEAVDDVRSAIQGVRADLPGDLRDPVVQKLNLAGTPVLAYTVRSARMDDEALSWLVDKEITRKLLSLRGVGAVNRVGGVTREVRVALDVNRLQSLGITAAEVSRQLKQVQQEGSGGRMDVGAGEQPVRTLATVKTAQEVGQIELATSRGGRVRLDQVATVSDTWPMPDQPPA
jgi:hypothetical protein